MTIFDTYFPDKLVLETATVQLRPMQMEDEILFRTVAASPSLWKYFTKELNDDTQLHAWVRDAFAMKQQQLRFPFTIVEKLGGKVCGSTSLGNPSFHDGRIEIGWSWLGETYRGTGINMHAKFLLLRYAFEVMGMERVEIKTDNLNDRSKAALQKIGARFEGVLRSHMLMPHGRRRDTAYFSILKNEWPWVKAHQFAAIIE